MGQEQREAVAYDVEEGEGAPDGIVGVGEGDGAEAILVVAMHHVLCRDQQQSVGSAQCAV